MKKLQQSKEKIPQQSPPKEFIYNYTLITEKIHISVLLLGVSKPEVK